MIRTLLACVVMASFAVRPAAAADERPNIVFIITDDQRWDCMSAAGHPFLKTPNMDRIAREGAMFPNAFVTTPLCSPARASFMTGQYAHTNGIKGNKPIYNEPSHKLVTFSMLLRDVGYESAYVGKWHMGNDDSPRPGYDRWVSFRGQGRYDDPTLNIDGKREEKKGYVTDILTDYAVEFINAEHDKPFVLYMGHKAVHGPFKPAARHAKLFEDEPLPRRPNVNADITGKPAIARKGSDRETVLDKGVNEKLIRDQLRCLVSVDESVGRILEALDEKKLSENTVVIFTSDNGYFWNEHGLGDKRAAYEESIRVPLVMRYPKLIKPGTRPADIVLNVDIAPTLLEMGKARSPQPMHGISLVALLSGKKPSIGRTAALFEYFHEPQFPRVPGWTAVRSDRWKYIRYPDFPEMDELYDLEADPYEMTNLANRPDAADAKEHAAAQMEKLLEETK